MLSESRYPISVVGMSYWVAEGIKYKNSNAEEEVKGTFRTKDELFLKFSASNWAETRRHSFEVTVKRGAGCEFTADVLMDGEKNRVNASCTLYSNENGWCLCWQWEEKEKKNGKEESHEYRGWMELKRSVADAIEAPCAARSLPNLTGEIQLQLHGPFSLIEPSTLPFLFSSHLVERPGIYLWTVHCNDQELIYYVGKSDRSFRTRLSEECRNERPKARLCIPDRPDTQQRRHLSGRPDCWDWIPDSEALLQGVKRMLYDPRGWKKPNLEQWLSQDEDFWKARWNSFLGAIGLFIAPMPLDTAKTQLAEKVVIATVFQSENRRDPFITNDYQALPPGAPALRMTRPAGSSTLRFRWLGEAIPE